MYCLSLNRMQFTLRKPTARLPREPASERCMCNFRRQSLTVFAKAERSPKAQPQQSGIGLKAVWIGAEKFGDLVGLTQAKPPDTSKRSAASSQATLTRREAVAKIKEDYDKTYFFTGVGDMDAYEPDCLFADPFTGFNGVERFKKNVSNLGGLLEDIKLDITDWEEGKDDLKTKWRISGIVQLPWKPLLAASGGTTHVFSKDTGRVVKHLEEWDVEPGRVLKRLLRPASRMPTNRWEQLMLSVHEGDAKGVWLGLSWPMLLSSAPVVGISLVCKLLTGEGLPGTFLGGVEGLAYLGLIAASITEIVKLTKQF